MSQLKDHQAEVVEIATAKGWEGPDAPPATFGDTMALITSEVSEALEAYRKWGFKRMVRRKLPSPYLDLDGVEVTIVQEDDGQWDESVKPEGVGSELADTYIRVLHYCDKWGVDLEKEYAQKTAYNRTRSWRHGGKAL